MICIEGFYNLSTHFPWIGERMRGNTETTSNGIKTWRFSNILDELETSFRILKECCAHLGGVHIELTGENVTECLGGACGVTEADLSRDYRVNSIPGSITNRQWNWPWLSDT